MYVCIYIQNFHVLNVSELNLQAPWSEAFGRSSQLQNSFSKQATPIFTQPYPPNELLPTEHRRFHEPRAARQMVINSCLEGYCATEQESKDFSLGIWGLAHSHFKPNEE